VPREGDGALGFWKALAKVYGKTRTQRCWVHYAEPRVYADFKDVAAVAWR
jgi:transposase-like protein